MKPRCLASTAVAFLLVAAMMWASPAPAAEAQSPYPREHIYDTAVGPDEALVNVSLVNNRWPDCTTLESAIRDMFRLEGVQDKPDQDKALALWKWYRILMSSTGGGYAYEGPAQRRRICKDPHRIFTVYGHHQCDGLSWGMAPLWRAAGYMAFDECTHGHTTAALRYRDADGVVRYHTFDPQARAYYWNAERKHVGTWSLPVMTGRVYRHVLAPEHIHSLRTSLRIGETIDRRWANRGRIVPSATKEVFRKDRYYGYEPGKTRGIYAVVGEEVQTFEARVEPALFKSQLYTGSENVACSRSGDGAATLHPAEAGKPAIFLYRLAKPYVVVEATVEATLASAAKGDLCRLSISRDGAAWQTIFAKAKLGTEKVNIDLGRMARVEGKPDLYTAYDFFLKAELMAAGNVRSVGIEALKVTACRMLNKRTLPNLMPGENVFRISADRIAPGWALRLAVKYQLDGKDKEAAHTVAKFPYYFRIDAPGVKLRKIGNYDQDFGNEAVRMVSCRMDLRRLGEGDRPDKGMPENQAAAKFTLSSPHPANMTRHRKPKKLEADPIETSGFFPQSRVKRKADDRMRKLVADLQRSGDSSYTAWRAAQELGNYPEAVDVLCKRLRTSNIDLTLHVCKALAQIADPKAVGPLLKKWQLAPRGAPGTRYIPDALAAIGDRKVVPALVAKLKSVRFDFRFHVAHALGILGGPDAEKALADLAKNDPFPAVREEAKAALRKLRENKP